MSEDNTVAMTCVSFLNPSGNNGRNGRSIRARREHLYVTQAAFALEKAAWDLAGGVGLLHVLTGEREEVDTWTLVGGHCCHQHDALTERDEHRAVRELRQTTSLEREWASPHHDGFTYEHEMCALLGAKLLLRAAKRRARAADLLQPRFLTVDESRRTKRR
ncbi:MAG: hypothetical protein QM756_10955 [Polyangiaceae bacterium]